MLPAAPRSPNRSFFFIPYKINTLITHRTRITYWREPIGKPIRELLASSFERAYGESYRADVGNPNVSNSERGYIV
jgi:hypothetical protein